jgi:glutamate-ammonia-ligase adenylyltransferase
MLVDWTVADANSIESFSIPFRDGGAGERNLAAVRARVPEGVFGALKQLLANLPDPDAALNMFERLTGSDAEDIVRLFVRDHVLLHYALVVFASSQWLSETLIQNPDIFQTLLRDRTLDRGHGREDFAEAFARFRSRSLETDISLLLARFKRREYIRIMLRDVLRIARLAETTAEISALSDVLIEEALRDVDGHLRNRYGPPQYVDPAGRTVDTPFTVLSLGKLGGHELNYSSDIDLLFLYGDGPEPAHVVISNREYFIRLAQQVTDALSRVTREGATFRIDLRLRPQGGEGEPAVGLGHALDYYQHKAGDWELQAMIKLRHSAGDQALAREFIRRVQPIVYTEQWNFAAIETALVAREKIGQHRRRAVIVHKAEGIDVKLDRGGIRDIEFLVQCLQRVYGGAEVWLRSGGTLFSLQKLHDKEHISGKDFHELTTSYVFLRHLEHRLQLRQGQQTHRLPLSGPELQTFARMLRGPDAQPEDLLKQVRAHMSAVAEIYERIIHQQQQVQQVRQEQAPAESLRRAIVDTGETVHRQLLERLAVESPPLLELVQRPEMDPHTRRNLFRFLAAALTSAERFAMVAHVPAAVRRALKLLGQSEYLTDILVRHPEEIAALAEAPKPWTAPESGEPGLPADLAALRSDEVSYGEKLGGLRRAYRTRAFLSGARDVLQPRPVYESLAETTCAAEAVINVALEIAGAPPEFAVLALGRLGTYEHDLLSDADLLFVRAEEVDSYAALRVAERVVETLSAYTRDGAVFPVDARLRPHGNDGELVQTPAQLEAYFAREAQGWEAVTYAKLRYVGGSQPLAERVLAATEVFGQRFAKDPNFLAELREMRAKLEKTHADEFDNLKTGPGGLYDIDYIIGALLIRTGRCRLPGNVRQRLQALRDQGLLSEEDFRRLDRHGELLRTVEHVVRLVTGKSRQTLPVAGPLRAVCDDLCARMMQREFPEGVDITLRFALVGVRKIYQRLLEHGGETVVAIRGGGVVT